VSVKKEEIGPQHLKLEILINPEDYQPGVEKSLKDYARKIDLKGFRKGHVPKGIIKKMYGIEILAEELNKLVGKELNEYLESEKLKILGEPMAIMDKQIKFDPNSKQPYTFEFEIGLQPDISLDFLNEKPSIVRHKIKIDEEMLNKEIEHLQRRYGKVSQADAVQSDEDVVKVKLEELDENGEPAEKGIVNEPAIAVEVFKKSAKSKLKKLKRGESMEIDLKKDLDKDYDEVLTEVLNLQGTPPEHDRFRLTLLEINHTEKAPLDQELFDKVYGKDNVKSEEAFREKVKEELAGVLANYEDQQLQRDIADTVMEKTALQFPEDFLKRWLKSSNPNLSEEDIEDEFPRFLEGIKWNLIKTHLLKEADAKISREDLLEQTSLMIKAEYGLGGDDEQSRMLVKQLAEKMLEDKEHVNRVYEILEESKVFDLLKDKFEIKEKEVSLEKFKDLNKKKK